nr:hypothetical protein Itr_chr02CG02140 [Ipomoea trifida]
MWVGLASPAMTTMKLGLISALRLTVGDPDFSSPSPAPAPEDCLCREQARMMIATRMIPNAKPKLIKTYGNGDFHSQNLMENRRWLFKGEKGLYAKITKVTLTAPYDTSSPPRSFLEGP